jgi:hypothetical protein
MARWQLPYSQTRYAARVLSDKRLSPVADQFMGSGHPPYDG